MAFSRVHTSARAKQSATIVWHLLRKNKRRKKESPITIVKESEKKTNNNLDLPLNIQTFKQVWRK